MSEQLQPGQHVKVQHAGVIVGGPDDDGDYRVKIQHPSLGEEEEFIHGDWITPTRPEPKPGDVWNFGGRLQAHVSQRRGAVGLTLRFADGTEMTTGPGDFLRAHPSATRVYTMEA